MVHLRPTQRVLNLPHDLELTLSIQYRVHDPPRGALHPLANRHLSLPRDDLRRVGMEWRVFLRRGLWPQVRA